MHLTESWLGRHVSISCCVTFQCKPHKKRQVTESDAVGIYEDYFLFFDGLTKLDETSTETPEIAFISPIRLQLSIARDISFH